MKEKFTQVLLVVGLLTLSACGGGSGSQSPIPPAVVALPDPAVVFTRSAGGGPTDIYAVDEDGQNLRALADSPDQEYPLALTADGRLIYARIGTQGDLYSVRLDGSDLIGLATSAANEIVNLTFEDLNLSSPLTANGDLVFTRSNNQGQQDLYLVNVTGTAEVLMATDVNNYFGQMPSGRLIFDRSSSGIISVLPDGTDERVVAGISGAYVEEATPSGRIVYYSAGDLFSVLDDGTDTVTLANAAGQNENFQALTADNRVVFSRYDSVLSQNDLYSIKADGSGLVTLANTLDNETFNGVTPDGRVIYSRKGTQTDLYIVNANGGGTVALTTAIENDSYGGVLSSGKILFIRYLQTQSDLFIVDADGSNELRLTDTAQSEELGCRYGACESPDGRILFTRRISGTDVDLYSIQPDGSDEVALATTSSFETARAIGSGGRVIIESADVTTNEINIYSINADGSDLRALADSVDSEQVYDVY